MGQILKLNSLIVLVNSIISPLNRLHIKVKRRNFYPRDVMLARSLRQRRVCLSGRLFVTRRYCAKTVHFRRKVTMGR